MFNGRSFSCRIGLCIHQDNFYWLCLSALGNILLYGQHNLIHDHCNQASHFSTSVAETLTTKTLKLNCLSSKVPNAFSGALMLDSDTVSYLVVSICSYKGMLSCFFQGFSNFLLRSNRSDRQTRWRVSLGIMISSIYPRLQLQMDSQIYLGTPLSFLYARQDF